MGRDAVSRAAGVDRAWGRRSAWSAALSVGALLAAGPASAAGWPEFVRVSGAAADGPVVASRGPQDLADALSTSLGRIDALFAPRRDPLAAWRAAPLPAAYAQLSEGGTGEITLEPITVTGEKVERGLERTFTSVGVVTDRQVRDFNIRELRQAFNLTANARSFPANRGNNGFSIRGLNSEGVTQPTNSAPLVSVIIDGATQNIEATRRGARGLWDVDQVEILRGPQSTVQGRNALAGAVFVRTKDPTFAWEGAVDNILGAYEERQGAFTLSGPLLENELAFRVAGQAFAQEKGIRYTDPANRELDDDEFRTLRGKLLWQPASLPGFRALLTASDTFDRPAVNSVTGPRFFRRVFDLPSSAVEFRETGVRNYISDVSYLVAPGVTLRSLSALADTATEIGSARGSPFQRDETRDGDDLTQDLRAEIDLPATGLSGVVGGFFGRFEQKRDSDISFLGTNIQDLRSTDTTASAAAYADLRYRFLDRWQLIAGGRALRETVRNASDATFVGERQVTDDRTSYQAFLPKVGLAFDVTPTDTLAATLSRGYRAGFSETLVTGVRNTVDPEFLTSYELAYRTRLLDDRLQAGANAFFYHYTGQQVALDIPGFPGFTRTENAGASHAYGAEIDLRWRPTDELTLFGALGLLRTEFDRLRFGADNFAGHEFPEAPSVTFAVGAAYRHPSGLFAAADLSFTDGFFSSGDLSNSRLRFVDDFTLVNARLGYEVKNLAVALFARNLLDEQYLTSISVGRTEATIGDPRTVGVQFTARF